MKVFVSVILGLWTNTSGVTFLIDALRVMEESQSFLARDLSHLSKHCGQIHLFSPLLYFRCPLCANRLYRSALGKNNYW